MSDEAQVGMAIREVLTGLVGTLTALDEEKGVVLFTFETKQGGKRTRVGPLCSFKPYKGVLYEQDLPETEGSFAETKRVMMLAYPRLFLHEHEVYSHLFFTNGNGFDWEDDGTLSSGETTAEMLDLAEQSRKGLNGLLDLKEPDGIVERRAFEANYRETFRKSGHRDAAVAWQRLPYMCEYSSVVNVPFNARPDWVEGARYALDKVAPMLIRTPQDDRWLAYANKRLGFIERGDREGLNAFDNDEKEVPTYD